MPSAAIGKHDLNEEVSSRPTSEEVISEIQSYVVEFLRNYEEISEKDVREMKDLLTESIREKIEGIFG